jgi:hypothetical protein
MNHAQSWNKYSQSGLFFPPEQRICSEIGENRAFYNIFTLSNKVFSDALAMFNFNAKKYIIAIKMPEK